MTVFQPIGADCRELSEIDALVRALANLRHWSAAAHARQSYADDRGQRLLASARRMRDDAWGDALTAAYRLFEIDAIHQQWIDSGGRRHVG